MNKSITVIMPMNASGMMSTKSMMGNSSRNTTAIGWTK